MTATTPNDVSTSPRSLSELAQMQERLARTEAAIGRFVPEGLVHLLGAQNLTELRRGQHLETTMTVLFTDIRNFTQQSENMTAAQTYAFINDYLGSMEPAIEAHGGFIDKYIGDAIMALFPRSADDAVRSAIDMLQRLADGNDRRQSSRPLPAHLPHDRRTRQSPLPTRIGIGLNTGIVMLGLVGGKHRLELTVLSDAVNLSSRLESMTKTYGISLLISEQTLYNLQDPNRYCVRFIDRIRVKGKSQPHSVYEVFDADLPALREGKLATRHAFEEAVAYYHLNEIDRAEPLLQACLDQVPDDQPAQTYLSRCREYRATGIHHATGEVGSELVWRDEFLVGNTLIDGQHQELLAHINDLAAKVSTGDLVGIDDVMRFIGQYVTMHFETEEAMMHRLNYPHLAAHVQEHRSFTQRYLRLADDIAQQRHARLYLGFQIQLFLFDWFANHTTRTDRYLTRFIASQAGSTAVSA
ncbi:MAG: bacteriohemerythrin [Hydrogenophaga sp.]|uniref:bacteriohemerythrin n=1 Tax=Hydrogenophaga sp. TaxID=1904254 RepID=UPI00276AA6D4|nr:bacteriohemerythrin [Hydrogenophaga sp.]MDP2417280.1 bacteriohemerythrin [Hydrogenophaga sp.]MDZ4189309.1 bacteriohemerythrin [Hydrogenophaga sp.]